MTKNRKLVYLSSPFTHGNKKLNVLSHMAMFEALSVRHSNVQFYAPLAMCYFGLNQSGDFWRDERYWMQYDIDMLKRCDAIFIFDAVFQGLNDYRQRRQDSVGCKTEHGVALQHGIRVFEALETEDFERWLRAL